ncbi:outer membrane protein with beta-barrel domain [Rhodobacter aestuarii]|uniref:Outer membrane protein beta-barrel domain-containing protein n=1 Tax=Rhodobacter aestuarii TaxID=453582 RepID=A0A1N7NE26_9RHOB|nr:outer membrane beta-barrel protein [Rhodobacter aestuarii]PTV96403.1 outer membrane protein with beta-barrel domain [Rhodobacter aestuarii]SIS96546.1 Outer membrane protein beta-barrel domain-containing protein [Rhodobacter aestuarii]
MKAVLPVALVAALCAHGAFAGDVTGAYVGLDYSRFNDDSAGTLSKTSLKGSLEYGFTRDFSVQGDLAMMDFGLSNADASTLQLHGIYHASANASVGAFVGRDDVEGNGFNYLGLEGGFEQGKLEGEAYVGTADSDGINGSLLGLGVMYNTSDSFAFGASHDRLDVEGFDASRTQLEAEYHMDKVTLSAQIGTIDIEDAGSEGYFGLGARVNFGAKRGTTFERRGLLEVIPGL